MIALLLPHLKELGKITQESKAEHKFFAATVFYLWTFVDLTSSFFLPVGASEAAEAWR